MNDVIAALGVLYDDLAKLQADAKIQKFSDAHPALMVHVIYLMPGNTCEGQAIPNPSRCQPRQTRDLESKCEAVKRQSLECRHIILCKIIIFICIIYGVLLLATKIYGTCLCA